MTDKSWIEFAILLAKTKIYPSDRAEMGCDQSKGAGQFQCLEKMRDSISNPWEKPGGRAATPWSPPGWG
jgi:hypothetical protein